MKKHIFFIVVFCICFFYYLTLNAQSVRVVDNKGTIRDINKVTEGTLPTSDLVKGDIHFDSFTNPKIISIWDGSNWRELTINWSLKGNAGTNPTTDFLGTTDEQDLVLKSNNIEGVRISYSENTNETMKVLINGAHKFNSRHPLIIKAFGDNVIAFEPAGTATSPEWHINLQGNGLNFVQTGVAAYRLFLENGGNVGIGINNPTERLDVNGRARIRTIDSGNTTDEMLVADTDGVVKKLPNPLTVGDIKYSVRTDDHKGWYLLNGRAISSLTSTAQTSATTLGLGTNLPDARDRVLKHPQGGESVGDIGGATTTTLTQANLPNVNFIGNTNTTGNHSHTNSFTSDGVTSWVGTANVLISGGGTPTSSSIAGNHSHTVSVNSGGSGVSFERYQPYLAVNTFIYLGE